MRAEIPRYPHGLLSVVLLAGLGLLAYTGFAEGLTLKDLLDSPNSIIVGDKEFFGFREFISAGNAAPSDPSRITISPLQDGFGPGIRIVGDAEFLAGAGQIQATNFRFDARNIHGENTIVDIRLALTPNRFGVGAGGAANVLISEVTDGFGNPVVPLPDQPFVSGGVTMPPSDTAFFAPQDFLTMRLSTTVIGPAFVSEIDVNLSQVPEPTTLLLFGTTAAGLGLARWRQRRRGST
jgi:hypothetical protein